MFRNSQQSLFVHGSQVFRDGAKPDGGSPVVNLRRILDLFGDYLPINGSVLRSIDLRLTLGNAHPVGQIRKLLALASPTATACCISSKHRR